MQMVGDARSGHFPQVHAKVETFWTIRLRERALHTLRELHHLACSFRVEAGKIRSVFVGHDHNVAGGVRVAIQDDECFGTTKNDKSLRIKV